MIKPTIGRIVHFYDGNAPIIGNEAKPHAAIVVDVHSDREINIAAFSNTGQPWALTHVPLLQDDDPVPPAGNEYCVWMPFQKGQAAKTEQLEKLVADGEGRN